ncbi:MAG: class I SAM-dependent methyltransferase [Janthinobacterium lividum]
MSYRQAHLRRARHWIVNRGWRGFFEEMLRRAELKLKGKPLPGRPGPDTGPHPFDRAYAVDTTGLVWGEALDGGGMQHDAQYWATGYYGVAPSAFDAALDALKLDWHQYTFIDIGCGKGRALLLSMRYPFRDVLGIELSPALAKVAERNVTSFNAPWRQFKKRAEVITGDATTFALPSGPLVLFLYHPFAAPVMHRFLEHLARSVHENPRPLYLLYANPELAPILDQTQNLERVFDRHLAFNEEDIAADRFGSRSEHIIAYRSTLSS